MSRLDCFSKLTAQEWSENQRSSWKLNCLVYVGAVIIERRVKEALPWPGTENLCPKQRTEEAWTKKTAKATKI